MKKILILIATLFLSSVMFAQTIVTPTDNLMLVVKSAQRVGQDVEIKALITNNSKNEIVLNLVGGQYQTGMSGSIAYDNEGNIYELGDVLVSLGKKSYTDQYCGVSVPAGVSVKCSCLIKNVDKSASSISKVKLCVLCPEIGLDSTGVCFEINKLTI